MRFRRVFRLPWRSSDRIEQDFEAEVAFHLSMRAEELEAEGLSPEAAAAEARRQFGDLQGARRYVRTVDAGAERRARLSILFEELARDTRYGLRRLAKSPGFTLLAVFTLSMGIGANTAIFSLVDAFLLRPAPFADPETGVSIYELDGRDGSHGTLSYPNLEDLRLATEGVLEEVSAVRYLPVPIEEGGARSVRAGSAVTANYFTMAGVEPHIGRLFGPEEGLARGAHPVVVLSHRYWQTDYGADPSVIGTDVQLGDRAYTIIGVTPSGFRPMRIGGSDLYVPILMMEELGPFNDFENRNNHSLIVRGRLADGVGLAQAQAAADRLSERMRAEHPDAWGPGDTFALLPLSDVILLPEADPYLRAAGGMLVAVVGLVLLLACTNLAGFLLARAVDRRREIGLRLALGATGRTVATQLMVESGLLGLLGGVAGVGVAYGVLEALSRLDPGLGLPLAIDVGVDRTALVFTLGVSLIAGVLLGAMPAVTTRGTNLATGLRNQSAGGGAHGHARWRSTLVVSQLAISSVLLVGAGLFLKSFRTVLEVDPGFGRRPAATVSVMLPRALEYDGPAGRELTQRLLDAYRTLPQVETVGLITTLPLDLISSNTTTLDIPGVDPPPGQVSHRADERWVDPGLLEAAGIRLLKGRAFTDEDDASAAPVALVSEEFERRFFPEGGAVGRTVLQADGTGEMTIVGVVEDVKIRTLSEEPRPTIYNPWAQRYSGGFVAVASIRDGTEATARATVEAMARATAELDPELMVWDRKTLDEHVATQQLPARLSALLLAVFAVLGLALAAIGLYGLVSYAVAQRTREAGVRMALGADPSTVVRMLTGGGLRLVLVGAVIGTALSLAVAGLLGRLLFDAGSSQLGLASAALAVMVATGAVAAYLPARRASRVDPVEALRSE